MVEYSTFVTRKVGQIVGDDADGVGADHSVAGSAAIAAEAATPTAPALLKARCRRRLELHAVSNGKAGSGSSSDAKLMRGVPAGAPMTPLPLRPPTNGSSIWAGN